MKNQSQTLIRDIKMFLGKNIRKNQSITDFDALTDAFLMDFPEYKESYEKNSIASEIKLFLSTIVL